MALFGRRSQPKGRPLSLPGDAEYDFDQPDAQRDLFTFCARRRAIDGVPKEDFTSFLDAQYARELGLGQDEELLAWGPVWVSRHDDRDEFEGTAVVTSKSVVAWWQPRKRRLIHTFHAYHEDFIAYNVEGPTAGHFAWNVGDYADNSGKFLVGSPVMYIASRFSNTDGHANRRTMEFYWTFSSQLTQHLEEQEALRT